MKGVVASVSAALIGIALAVPLVVVSSTTATALQCLPLDVAVGGEVPASLGWSSGQVAVGTSIVSTSVTQRWPSAAAVDAVAGALAASSLGDVVGEGVYGVGSRTWGTLAQRADPVAAASTFLARLGSTPGWVTLEPVDAVVSVLPSVTPASVTAATEPARLAVASLLGRPAGGTGPDDGETDPSGAPITPEDISCGGSSGATGSGDYGTVPVGDCSFTLPRANPRTCQDAIRWGLAQVDGAAQWSNLCLHFVVLAYGWSSSGDHVPRVLWERIPNDYKHPGDMNPPAGALVFWRYGPIRPGHITLSLGGGRVLTNDFVSHGRIGITTVAAITAGWGPEYLGWSVPYFPDAG